MFLIYRSKDLKQDFYLAPYGCAEIGFLYLDEGDLGRAQEYLERARYWIIDTICSLRNLSSNWKVVKDSCKQIGLCFNSTFSRAFYRSCRLAPVASTPRFVVVVCFPAIFSWLMFAHAPGSGRIIIHEELNTQFPHKVGGDSSCCVTGLPGVTVYFSSFIF